MCWGSNSYGQLGTQHAENSFYPFPVQVNLTEGR